MEDVALVHSEKSNSSNINEANGGLWYIDSAATRHMTHDKSILMDFRMFPDNEKPSIYLGNDHVVHALGEGKVRLSTDDCGTNLALHKVAYVPELTKNLLSVPAMTQMKAKVMFDEEKCIVMKEDKDKIMREYVIGKCIGGKLYCVGVPPPLVTLHFLQHLLRRKKFGISVWGI